MAPLSAWMTGVMQTLLRPSVFPSFRLIVASFLSQTKFSSWYELPLMWQTSDTVLFSSVTMTPLVLVSGADWMRTPSGRAKDGGRRLGDGRM